MFYSEWESGWLLKKHCTCNSSQVNFFCCVSLLVNWWQGWFREDHEPIGVAMVHGKSFNFRWWTMMRMKMQTIVDCYYGENFTLMGKGNQNHHIHITDTRLAGAGWCPPFLLLPPLPPLCTGQVLPALPFWCQAGRWPVDASTHLCPCLSPLIALRTHFMAQGNGTCGSPVMTLDCIMLNLPLILFHLPADTENSTSYPSLPNPLLHAYNLRNCGPEKHRRQEQAPFFNEKKNGEK